MRNVLAAVTVTAALLLTTGCSRKLTNTAPLQQPEARQSAPEAPDDAVKAPPPAPERLDRYLQTIYFDYNDATLLPESVRALERLAPRLAANRSIRLQAEGHCDERGSSEYNMGLGEKRARAVRAWLISYGISGDAVEFTSFGKERPARSDCSNDECHAANRRVEWKVLSMPDNIALSSR